MFQLLVPYPADAARSGRFSLWWSARDLRRRAGRSLDGSDEELLCQVARGDTDALAVLHHRWADLVQANVRRVLREPALTQMLTEQVLDELPTLASRFDPNRGNARIWLLALAHERATAWATAYTGPPRSVAASEPSTTSLATRLSFRLARRA